MKRELLIKEMKECVGQKDPVVYFEKMTDAFNLLFDKLEELSKEVSRVKTNSALSIEWDEQVASDMLLKQIEVLRADKDTYHTQITLLKLVYAQGEVVKSYNKFVNFWLDTLGWHPFLDYSQ